MGDLTAHFDLAEFSSRDGAPFSEEARENLPRLAAMLERLRDALAKETGRPAPLLVLSGYRSPAHNAKVGGVPNSYHVKGMAADVTCRYAFPRTVQRVALRLQSQGVVGGVGSYLGFTHVDVGTARAWDETTRVAKGGAPG